MKVAALSIGLFAASAAAAHNHNAAAKRQYLVYNTTMPNPVPEHTPAPEPSTTLVVYHTKVFTVTDCPATVKDCPARSGGKSMGQVVTKTLGAYTTVCPVTKAQSAASAASHAMMSTYSAAKETSPGGYGMNMPPTVPAETPGAPGYGKVPHPPAGTPQPPYPTGESQSTAKGPVGTGVNPKGDAPYPTLSGAESIVLTYTLGSGTSTTVVTTTIKHTKTNTVYATKPAGEKGPGYGAGPPAPEVTTTVQARITSTRYITIVAAPSAPVASDNACLPVTVTVTKAVTVPGSGSCPNQPTGAPTAEGSIPSGPAGGYPVDSGLVPVASRVNNAGPAGPAITPPSNPPVPGYPGSPYGNSTMTSTKKKCSSVFPPGHPSYVSTAVGVPSSTAPTSSHVPTSTSSHGPAPTGGYPVVPPPVYPLVAAASSSSIILETSTAAGPAVTPPVPVIYSTATVVPVPSEAPGAYYPMNPLPVS
ncbi:uncharacterized protein L3040_005727 [Drepanopeziza brunnea f. sp. 'multigermtubi']|uniref:Extracellular serine-threonine rich protein n=1 Tax=Marssonina brunnea f. sp. multigermtubi (strain MB_m1) TaxID=1072389 RepID=K1WNC7_MARBU|nr:uncharacterized protein MBM_07162 [Drepanopeziza brunnea f. sp. 'multigermtubi' MB_m1]EKD14441.1 hypothetical protein MBM_07162 [Drepanopeziza brunnea f. sp. 'multigermtubi' MB_m1]KAJ5041176.1 hypothetical protein L3040_005727 [Drepanopeziza brunnea f. sp. 'multigermtubi']